MSSGLFSRKDDTLTARNIVDAYVSAYNSVHSNKPECYALDSKWFVVNGIERDRKWMVLEVERLRQEALSKVIAENDGTTGSIFRMIRRLSRL
ncbi:MAG: hypothetical protein KJ064_22290 [Anaerolineae bacterium]|jgi:hypothetical protein|nr:MAG: hypothetical protein F9K27_15275 [Anaerolineae bacterium]MCL4879404.1 hypothetical protein [Anaerolineae bacterium]